MHEDGIRVSRLEALEQSFEHKDRDFVFLVNQSTHQTSNMSGHISIIRKSLASILDNEDGAVENNDRIALVKFAQNSKRIFSLVEKHKNFT